MRDAPAFGVVVLHTTSAALRAEKKLIVGGLAVKLIPTPREMSSDCGIALRFDWRQAGRVQELLEEAHIAFQAIQEIPPNQ
jgi:hypothetical protein